jgi:hypothetical protein
MHIGVNMDEVKLEELYRVVFPEKVYFQENALDDLLEYAKKDYISILPSLAIVKDELYDIIDAIDYSNNRMSSLELRELYAHIRSVLSLILEMEDA